MAKKHLFLAYIALFVQLYGYAKDQRPINLGETPWRFSKVIQQETNLAKDANILYESQKVPEINDGNSIYSLIYMRRSSSKISN